MGQQIHKRESERGKDRVRKETERDSLICFYVIDLFTHGNEGKTVNISE